MTYKKKSKKKKIFTYDDFIAFFLSVAKKFTKVTSVYEMCNVYINDNRSEKTMDLKNSKRKKKIMPVALTQNDQQSKLSAIEKNPPKELRRHTFFPGSENCKGAKGELIHQPNSKNEQRVAFHTNGFWQADDYYDTDRVHSGSFVSLNRTGFKDGGRYKLICDDSKDDFKTIEVLVKASGQTDATSQPVTITL